MYWCMTKHGALSDSTTEEKHKELVKLVNDMKFEPKLSTELNLAKLLGYILEDNSGSMFLDSNRQVIKRTKDTDLKHCFIREFSVDKNGCK